MQISNGNIDHDTAVTEMQKRRHLYNEAIELVGQKELENNNQKQENKM